MFRRLFPYFVLLLSLLMHPAVAAADTINFIGTGKGSSVRLHSPELGDVRVRAGELLWTAPSSPGLDDSFYSYCVDVNHWLQPTQVVTLEPSDNLVVPGVEQAGAKAAWLVNTYAPTIHESGTNTEAAALQVAIWAALYNPTGSLTTGSFWLISGGPVSTQAQLYLDALFSGPTGFQTSDALWLNTGRGQDQMIPTPEPGSMLLVGTGLLAAWRRARRQARPTLD